MVMFCLYENLIYFTDLFGELKIILVYRVFQKNGGGVHFRWSKFFPQPIFHCIPFFLNHCYGVTSTICVVRVFLKSLLWFDFCYLCCEIYSHLLFSQDYKPHDSWTLWSYLLKKTVFFKEKFFCECPVGGVHMFFKIWFVNPFLVNVFKFISPENNRKA